MPNINRHFNKDIMKDKKIFAFDMDGTLAESRKDPILQDNFDAIQRLIDNQKIVVVVSSGECSRLFSQICTPTRCLKGTFYVIGNYGLDTVKVKNGTIVEQAKESYKESLSIKDVESKISTFREEALLTDYLGESHVIFDSGLIAVALTGTGASKEARNSYDPDGTVRIKYVDILKKYFSPEEYSIYSAGKTSLDVLRKEFDKSEALKKFVKKNGCKTTDVVFFGDEIERKYGNDSSIKNAGLDYIPIERPIETALIINEAMDQVDLLNNNVL